MNKLESWKKFASKLSFEPAKNSINIDKVDNGGADYEELVDAFSRELTSDEIMLISGADKGGLNYCPGCLYV